MIMRMKLQASKSLREKQRKCKKFLLKHNEKITSIKIMRIMWEKVWNLYATIKMITLIKKHFY